MAEPVDPLPQFAQFEEISEEVRDYFDYLPEFGEESELGGVTPDVLGDVQATPWKYRVSALDVRYDLVRGVKVQRDASDGDFVRGDPSPPGRVVRLHGDYWVKTVVFTYERENAWPYVPHPDPNDDNQVLVSAFIQPARPAPGPDGSILYRVSGTYAYELLGGLGGVTSAALGPFPTGGCESSKLAVADGSLPAEALNREVLG